MSRNVLSLDQTLNVGNRKMKVVGNYAMEQSEREKEEEKQLIFNIDIKALKNRFSSGPSKSVCAVFGILEYLEAVELNAYSNGGGF